MRFALDQNFPPFVLDAATHIPEADLVPISRIDPRLGALGDRELVIYLYQDGWDGLITNNYRMLWVPTEIAAIVKTGLALCAVQGLGDDPLRATGALMLHLPAVIRRLETGSPRVFRINPAAPKPRVGWEYFLEAAQRRNREPDELYSDVQVTDTELESPVLPDRRD